LTQIDPVDVHSFGWNLVREQDFNFGHVTIFTGVVDIKQASGQTLAVPNRDLVPHTANMSLDKCLMQSVMCYQP